MTQVIQLFPRHSPVREDAVDHDGADVPSSHFISAARREAASAIRYCLESLLQDAEGFDLRVTRAALVVAIAAASNEID